MSAEIINLRQVRKQRAREQKAAEAAENRTRSGRTKAERELDEHSRTRAAEVLEGHFIGDRGTSDTVASRDAQDDGPARPEPKPRR